ncbi:MAG: hypothetical protein ACRDTT_04935, partial [Pseudonocardiaceae bacterium]
AKTYTTAVGELRAVAVGARTVLPLYKHKKMSVFMSAEYSGHLQADTLILGGPLRNTYAAPLWPARRGPAPSQTPGAAPSVRHQRIPDSRYVCDLPADACTLLAHPSEVDA